MHQVQCNQQGYDASSIRAITNNGGKVASQSPKVIKVERPAASKPSRKRVAAYARVSVDSDELMQSLAAQVSHYSAHIQANPS
jgi:predicted site-specific integrase-resolvase